MRQQAKTIKMPSIIGWAVAVCGVWLIVQGAMQFDPQMVALGIWILIGLAITAVNIRMYNEAVDRAKEADKRLDIAKGLLSEAQNILESWEEPKN